jgi:hypothetical protein
VSTQSYQAALLLTEYVTPWEQGTPLWPIRSDMPIYFGWYGAGLRHPDFTRFFFDAATGRAFTER